MATGYAVHARPSCMALTRPMNPLGTAKPGTIFQHSYRAMMEAMRSVWWLGVLLAAGGLPAQDDVKFDTPEVRVLLATSSPGQRSALHKHLLNRVMIYLDDGHMELTDAQGKVEEVRWRAGDVRWSPAGGPHISENVGMTTYRIVEVELKNSGGAMHAPELDPVRVDPKHYT